MRDYPFLLVSGYDYYASDCIMPTFFDPSETNQTGNYSNPSIDKAKDIKDKADQKQKKAKSKELKESLDKAKNLAAEAASKAAAMVEQKLNNNVEILEFVPEKIPMNITESLTTKIGPVVGLNPTEVAQEIQGGKFVKTAFLGRSIDAVGVVDVYGIKDSSVQNKAPDGDITVIAVTIKKLLKGEDNLKEDLKSLMKLDNGLVDISPAALTDRVKCALGNSSAAVNSLGASLKGSITNDIAGSTTALMDKFTCQINDVVSQCVSQSPVDARGLFDTVQRLVGNEDVVKLLDTGAEAQLLTGLFGEAVDMKLPGIVELLASKASSSAAMNQAMQNVFDRALSSGDAETILSIANVLGSNRVLALDPLAASKILSNYQCPGYTPQWALSVLATTLVNTLNAVDPQWATVNRGTTDISNLSVFYGMSDDAKRVLETKPEYQDLIAISPYYSTESFTDSMQAKYPFCPNIG